MEGLQRVHAHILGLGTVFRAIRAIAFRVLVFAGCIWLISQQFEQRAAALLTVAVVVFGVKSIFGVIGEALGPPEPFVKSTTRLETRRGLRRAGLLGKHGMKRKAS